MKIAIFGNGKMGKKISQIAIRKGHKIICTTDSKRPAKFSQIRNVFPSFTHCSRIELEVTLKLE